MNANDRAALQALAEQLSAIERRLEALADEETRKAIASLVEVAPALKDLAEKAPALKDLADGYKMAGIAGNFIKWIAGIATAVVALAALVRLYIFGDAK